MCFPNFQNDFLQALRGQLAYFQNLRKSVEQRVQNPQETSQNTRITELIDGEEEKEDEEESHQASVAKEESVQYEDDFEDER